MIDQWAIFCTVKRPLIRGMLVGVSVSVLLSIVVYGQEEYVLNEAYEWQQQTSYDPATPEGQLQVIRKVIEEDRLEKARELADRWIKEYPNHPLLVEAYLLRGDAKVRQEEYYDALYDYEYIIVEFPGAEQYLVALEREYEIARKFAAGLKRKMLGMRMIPAMGEAEDLLIRVQERAPGSELGERASLALGEVYFNQAEMTEAVVAYDMFLLNYPNTRFREGAMLNLIRASLAMFKGPRFDPHGLIDAAERISAYREEFPAAAEQLGANSLLLRINESLAIKTYYSAEWYYRTGERVSAVYLYRRVVKDYPHTVAAQAATRWLETKGESIVDSASYRQTAPDGEKLLDTVEQIQPDHLGESQPDKAGVE